VPARHVSLASTGYTQEDPLKHRARPAARASTGLVQDKQMKHPARHVSRTRPRLLRAVLRPPALAMQATVATLAQEIAQRAGQATTKLKRLMVIARHVSQESGKARQEQGAATTARQTRTHPVSALRSRIASATRATRAPMDKIAQRAWPESTRTPREQVCAAIVRHRHILQQSGPHQFRHASRAQIMLTQMSRAQSWQLAGATRGTQGPMEARAHRVLQERTRC
jgi:hypothetical protein